jgi:hypothetical protein
MGRHIPAGKYPGEYNQKRMLFFDGESWMTDVEDLKLKAEIDEIMESVDNIMQKVETVIPAKPEESQASSE